MKTKEEILKMNKKELRNYKCDEDLDEELNFNCFNCIDCLNSIDLFDCDDCINCRNCRDSTNLFDCINCRDSIDSFDCLDCKNCKNCAYCRNIKHKQYCICNVQLTEEEYKKKIKELEEQK